jgi:hypothetical protein
MSNVRHADASPGPSTPNAGGRIRRLRDRWIYPAIGLLVALGKAHAFRLLSRHRLAVAPVAAAWILISLLKARPVGLAVSAGVLAVAADSGGPLWLALVLGLATFSVLMAVFLGTATVLQLRQPEWRPGRTLVRAGR